MPILLLIRHGETDWNRSGQVMGNQPIPLNQTGERQALACAEMLAQTPITGIVTSPVLRAVQTAHIVGRSHAAPVHQAPGLSEIGVGAWINRYWKDLAEDPAKRDWYAHPDRARPSGGETLREVQQRAVAAVEQTLQVAQDGPYVFVSHGDVIRALLAHYLRLDLNALRQARIDHAGVSGIEVTEAATHLLFLNHRPGLHRLA
ncbi:MAG: putative phosphoglycerate mutase GpmB [Nitrospira sp.]|nr:histidine phosphatase family protein [Nitrospira sp.]ULA59698.1 MAG: putative phosphoglycerate mutase GpmB [Nitrospira sp.]